MEEALQGHSFGLGNVLSLASIWWMSKISLTVFIAYRIALVVQNIFFSPLSKFPGPMLGAATSWYWEYYLARGVAHNKMDELHAKYGETVRFSPNRLSFIGENGWRDIYMHKQGRPQFQKVNRNKPIDGAYSIFNANDEVHARQRKMLSHAFSDRALREQEPILATYINLFISNIHDDIAANRPVDIKTGLNYTTFDIIGALTFGESFHALELRRDHPWIVRLFDIIRYSVLISPLMAIPAIYVIFKIFNKLLLRGRNFMVGYAKEQVEKRIELGNRGQPDFMSKVLPHKREPGEPEVEGGGISKGEIVATSVVLIIAGSETTATLLAGCVYLLCRHPRVMEKLRREVNGAVESIEDITINRVSHLPYLSAVIEESLRCYTPVPNAFSRMTPPDGATICGHWVPGNVIVGVPQRAAYRSENNFIDPLDFVPERWATDRDPKFEEDRRAVFQPFSAGPRNCLGRNLAYAEMRLILTRLLFEFDFELADKQHDWLDQKAYVVWEKPALMLNMKQRKRSGEKV